MLDIMKIPTFRGKNTFFNGGDNNAYTVYLFSSLYRGTPGFNVNLRLGRNQDISAVQIFKVLLLFNE